VLQRSVDKPIQTVLLLKGRGDAIPNQYFLFLVSWDTVLRLITAVKNVNSNDHAILQNMYFQGVIWVTTVSGLEI